MKTRRHLSHPSMTSSPCTRILGSHRICQRVSYDKSSIKPAGGVGGAIYSEQVWVGRGSRLVFCRLSGPVFDHECGSFFQTAAGNRGLWRTEDLGLNKVKFSRPPPPWMLLHWSDPATNFWWLSWFPPPRLPRPHVFIFQAHLSDPPLNPSKVFSDPPFWVLSYDWSTFLFS